MNMSPTDKICGRSLSSLYIMCTFGIQVWEFAFCHIMWIRPSFRDEKYNLYRVFCTSCTWFCLYLWNCMSH